MMSDPWEHVYQFESLLASFYGSRFAVAVDCCTHAIELCLRHIKANNVSCPVHTYVSVPFVFEKLNLTWNFKNEEWKNFYFIGNTNVIDAAVYWKENGYIPGTFMCLSFQYKKHLNLSKGGAILTNSYEDYIALQQMAADGRVRNVLWKDQNISSVGYHYYMTPETAKLGIEKFEEAKLTTPKQWSYLDYPYLPNMEVFQKQ